jgi:hypothetical protein
MMETTAQPAIKQTVGILLLSMIQPVLGIMMES